jgi:radical SAM protein with 4Fe4S-binding SPASM domain
VDCSGHPDIDLGVLDAELFSQLQGTRYPLGGSIELTERCNLRCLHCYISQPAGSVGAAVRELTTAQVKGIVDQVVDAGCLFLLITGGEPLLRADFVDIWRYARGKGLLLTLFTNGVLLTAEIADLLAEYRPQATEITLYGATRETYERVTGVPGSYARCMRGIELLLDRGMRLNLKSVLLKANRHELEAMIELAGHLGVKFRFDGVLWPRLDGGLGPLDQRLDPGDIVALDREYPERQREFEKHVQRVGTGLARAERVYSCGAGQRSFHVDSAGRMSACMMARQPSYDLLQGSFQDGWRHFLSSVIKQKRATDTRCQSCTVNALCTQCPGWSQTVHGDNETPVDYVCAIGRLRAAQMVSVTAGTVT